MSEITSEFNNVIIGTPATKGVAIGRVHLLSHSELSLTEGQIDPAQMATELDKIKFAKEEIKKELLITKKIASTQKQAEIELILDTQLQILVDPELENQIQFHIYEQRMAADRAIWDSFQYFIDLLEKSRNQYMLERIPEINEIRNRLIRTLHQKHEPFEIEQGSILVSDEVTPSEVIQASKQNVKGIITDRGGLTSHSAIIAHSLDIPMIIGAKNCFKKVQNDNLVIIDADQGLFYIAPDQELVDRYQRRIRDSEKEKAKQLKILTETDTLACGTPFILQANIELVEEIDQVKAFRAHGIGLLRTESLLMGESETGSIDTQQSFYTTILNKCNEEVVIRLFDIGGDKLLGPQAVESNPFLGWRGVRVLLDRIDLLTDQLTAIYTVSAHYPGRIKILVPMISWLEEWFKIREVIDDVKQTLMSNQIPFDNTIPVGAMVEVPSMIVQADKFAKYVDFFSIGTNDLTQYILAVDRGNTLISHLYQQIHPSIFRAVSYAVRAANNNKKEISVCGESASNPYAAMAYLGLGIKKLSMTPNEIPNVKAKLRSVTLEQCKELAKKLFNAETLDDVKQIIQQY